MLVSILLLLMPIIFSCTAAHAELVTVLFLRGRNGKPVSKGVRVWVHFNNGTGKHILDLHTDQHGEIQFEPDNAITFQVSPVGYIACGEQPLGSPVRDYPVGDILKTGLLTRNDCGRLDVEPLKGRLLYFVRPASWWELFKN